MPYEFILFSRSGRTDATFSNLHDAGRLDIVYECIIASFFLSHGLRKDVIFHSILNGSPNPPLHIQISGQTLYDVRTDIETWQSILRKVISGRNHPGIICSKTSFEGLLKTKAKTCKICVLEEGGKSIGEAELAGNTVFVLGDHIGLPRKVEAYALRYGKKVSLGKKPYLSASCITILNYLIDRQA